MKESMTQTAIEGLYQTACRVKDHLPVMARFNLEQAIANYEMATTMAPLDVLLEESIKVAKANQHDDWDAEVDVELDFE